MAELEVTCPSGLRGRLRGLKGKDVRALATMKNSTMTGPALTQILRSCWLETLDPGPYAVNGGAEFHWDDALIGDRFYVLIQIRRATYPGEGYDFELTCTNPVCRKRISASIDLEELEVKTLPEEAREQFAEGKNRFETTTQSGQRVVFKLQTGNDWKRQKQIQDTIGPAAQGLVLSLASRIVEVDGLKSNNTRDVFAFLDDLEFSEHRDLLNSFEAMECGVVTDIGIECQWCGNTDEVSFPFARAFLLPTKKTVSSSAGRTVGEG